MSQHKISGNDILLFIGTDEVNYDTIVCLTSQSVTRATGQIEANTKCGPDTLPGTKTNAVTFEGQSMYDPDALTASTDQLDDYWRTEATIHWKMGKAIPGEGDLTYYGTGYIASLDETYAQDAPSTFSGSIGVYGLIQKTTATS